MGFSFDSWTRLKKVEELRQRYHENAALVLRSMEKPVVSYHRGSVGEHAFSHLFGKVFKVVPLPESSVEFTPERQRRSYKITDKQRLTQAFKQAEKEKTAFDD